VAESTPNPTVEAVEEPEMAQPRRSRRGIAIAIILVIVLVAVGVWWHSTFSVDTDDASINGHLMQISARVGGHVAKIYVQENQQVKAGDPIADLDPSDFQVAVENAQAALAQADAAAAAAQVFVPITSANTGSSLHSASSDVASTQAGIQQAEKQFEAARARVAQAEANNVRAQSDLARYRPLVEKDVISKQQFDGAEAAAKAAAADLAGARASQQAAGDGIRMARERESQSQAQLKYAQTGPQQVQVQSARAKAALAQVQQAQAQLDQAKLNLSYTHIVAPANGIVTRKSVELDQNISPGQNLLTLVSLDDLWVTANFKETQLKHMHNGQEAEIGVDSTGRKYHGRITQIGGATGSVLSLFPPENATGNYVKVVQRIPVRIDFTDLKNEDSAHALRPGLSVEPKVSVK
jgi:membrane fusion protein (multidrug efflux system)